MVSLTCDCGAVLAPAITLETVGGLLRAHLGWGPGQVPPVCTARAVTLRCDTCTATRAMGPACYPFDPHPAVRQIRQRLMVRAAQAWLDHHLARACRPS